MYDVLAATTGVYLNDLVIPMSNRHVFNRQYITCITL